MLTSMYIYLGGFVAVVIVLLALYIFINIKTKKSRILKVINGLENEKLNILKTPVNAMLMKLSLIGKNNVAFDTIYHEEKAVYDSLISEYADSLNSSISLARKLCLDGHYKKCNEQIKDIKLRLDSFALKMDELNAKVSDVLKDENDIKAQAEALKSKFIEVNNMFEDYKREVNFNNDKYVKLLRDIEQKFQILNDYTNRGNYNDAFDLIKVLSEMISYVHKNLEFAPSKVKRVIIDIPTSLNAIIDKYNSMQHEKYPLYNITANSKIASIKEELRALVLDLQNFNYENIDEKINALENKTLKLKEALFKEEDTRSYFDNNLKEIYDHASSLESKYLSIIREHDENRKKYQNNNKELDTLRDKIQYDVNNLNAIRLNLDSLNCGEQPYSFRVNKLNELKAQSDLVENDMQNYKDCLVSMRTICDTSVDLITTSATTLKKLELKIRNSKVQRLIQIYNESFTNGYQMINKLETICSIEPVDVERADSLSKRIEELVNDLKVNCENDLILLKEAEKLLMFTSKFKGEYVDFEKSHIKAEGFFYDCRYQECINTLVEACENIHVTIPFDIKGVEL